MKSDGARSTRHTTVTQSVIWIKLPSHKNVHNLDDDSGWTMMTICKWSLTFTMDSWLLFMLCSQISAISFVSALLLLPTLLDWCPKLRKRDKLKWFCLSVRASLNPRPGLVQHGPHAPSLCSSHHSALDFINTLFNLASSQYKPKYSTELAVSPSTGIGLSSVCVCVVIGTLWGGVGVWGGGHLILLDREALNHAGSSWKDPEGDGLGRLDSGRLPEPEPGLSLTPSWWWERFLPHPCRNRPRPPSAHQVGTLQAFSCTGKCSQPWLRLWLALITSASGTLENKFIDWM